MRYFPKFDPSPGTLVRQNRFLGCTRGKSGPEEDVQPEHFEPNKPLFWFLYVVLCSFHLFIYAIYVYHCDMSVFELSLCIYICVCIDTSKIG